MKQVFACRAVVLLCLALAGCATERYPLAYPSNWKRAEHWYDDGRAVDENKVDVFYVASTEVMSSVTPDGRKSPLAVLTRDECEAIARECASIRKRTFTDEFNFFSPIYHQVTFECMGEPNGGRNADWDAAADDVCRAFDMYMRRDNRGRRFILAGFSQGASIIRAVLRHMTDEQYARCVAAYAIGYQVTADDLKSPHIRPAQSATDQGVIISFNSVAKLSGALPFVSGDAACSINPANWRTDSQPATFDFKGHRLTATLDTTNNLVIVSGFPAEEMKNPFLKYFPEGSLHVFDRIMYAKSIHDNAMLRAYGK